MKKIDAQIINSIKDLLKISKKITILSHHVPDGDAIGSATALYELFKKLNYDTSIVMPSDFAENLKYIPNAKDIITYSEQTEKFTSLLNDADIIFCTDFNSPKRIEKAEETFINSPAKKIMLDHHPQPDDFFDFQISDTSVSSASEIVYEFIVLMQLEKYIDKNIAKSLYIGIMTDTINFTVNSERKRTFEIAANLLSFDINKKDIYNNFYNNFTKDRIRFSGYIIYEKMQITKSEELAYIIISQEELEKFNYKSGDHEGFVNIPLSIKSVETSIFIMEKQDYLKISLRSKSDFDVNLLARQFFNGGGHKNAAGGKLFININDAENYILNSYKKFIKG